MKKKARETNKDFKIGMTILFIILVALVGLGNFLYNMESGIWKASIWILVAVLFITFSIIIEVYYLTKKESFSEGGEIKNFKTFLVDNCMILVVSIVGSAMLIGLVDFLAKIGRALKFVVLNFKYAIDFLIYDVIIQYLPLFVVLLTVILYILFKWVLYRTFIKGGRK